MRERQSLHRKECGLCERIRHRDEMMLMPLSKVRMVEAAGRSIWLCFFCVEDLRKATSYRNVAFEVWRKARTRKSSPELSTFEERKQATIERLSA